MSSKRSSAPAAVKCAPLSRAEKWLAPTNPNTIIPAARAAATPATLSSITRRPVFGAAPITRAACRKRSGLGFPSATSAAGKNVGGEHRLVARHPKRKAQSLMPARYRRTHTRGAQAFDGLPYAFDPFQFAPKRELNLARKLVTKILGQWPPEFRFKLYTGTNRAVAPGSVRVFPDRSGERQASPSRRRMTPSAISSLSTSTPSQSKMTNSGQQDLWVSSRISRSVRRSISQARRFRAWNAAIAPRAGAAAPVASVDIEDIAEDIVCAPAATAPTIAEPRRTGSRVSGDSTVLLHTSAMIWRTISLRAAPPLTMIE